MHKLVLGVAAESRPAIGCAGMTENGHFKSRGFQVRSSTSYHNCYPSAPPSKAVIPVESHSIFPVIIYGQSNLFRSQPSNFLLCRFSWRPSALRIHQRARQQYDKAQYPLATGGWSVLAGRTVILYKYRSLQNTRYPPTSCSACESQLIRITRMK